MSAGFVYVLINPAMPNIVKIGRTAHSSSKRAKSLSGTAIPEDFVVVYDEFVTDSQSVERAFMNAFITGVTERTANSSAYLSEMPYEV